MNINLINELKILLREGKTQDEVLQVMKERSVLITDAIVAVRAVYGVGLGDAKNIVSSSIYWKGIHEANRELHDAIERFANEPKQSQED